MCPTCPQHPLTGCVSSDVSDDHLTMSESAATLVHAFVTSRVDQCNAVLARATKSVTLQRVMNAAARVVSDNSVFSALETFVMIATFTMPCHTIQ